MGAKWQEDSLATVFVHPILTETPSTSQIPKDYITYTHTDEIFHPETEKTQKRSIL